jgi:hypothetical protein
MNLEKLFHMFNDLDPPAVAARTLMKSPAAKLQKFLIWTLKRMKSVLSGIRNKSYGHLTGELATASLNL